MTQRYCSSWTLLSGRPALSRSVGGGGGGGGRDCHKSAIESTLYSTHNRALTFENTFSRVLCTVSLYVGLFARSLTCTELVAGGLVWFGLVWFSLSTWSLTCKNLWQVETILQWFSLV